MVADGVVQVLLPAAVGAVTAAARARGGGGGGGVGAAVGAGVGPGGAEGGAEVGRALPAAMTVPSQQPDARNRWRGVGNVSALGCVYIKEKPVGMVSRRNQ